MFSISSQWEAKQSRKREDEERENVRKQWVDSHTNFASFVSEEDVEKVTSSQDESESSELSQCLHPFFDIQEKGSKKVIFKGERYFIAESTETIRILIQQSTQANPNGYGLSPIQLKSIFLKPCSMFDEPVRLMDDVEKAMRIRRDRDDQNSDHPGFKVLIGSESVLSTVAGFPISRGALACGIVPMDRDETWLNSFLQTKVQKSEPVRILALDGICDNANLGSMIRCASAFGVNVVVISQDTCDCWYRRTIRVSMGHIFRIPIVRVNNLAEAVSKWSSPEEFNVTSYAAVLETDSLLSDIKHGELPMSWCCIMGSEGNGISLAVREAATHKLRIQIESDVDSLSVPVATGILLNGLREREER